MHRPTEEQFFCLFEEPHNELVHQTQAALIASYPEKLSDWMIEEDYLEVFSQVFCISLEAREHFFVLLEWLPEQLGEHCEVDIDQAYESAQLLYDNQLYHFAYSEDFDDGMARLQEILSNHYVIKEVFNGGIDDTLRLLLIPIPLWNQAEVRYGTARLEHCLIPYGTAAIRMYSRENNSESEPRTSSADSPPPQDNSAPLSRMAAQKSAAPSPVHTPPVLAWRYIILFIIGLGILIILYSYYSLSKPKPPTIATCDSSARMFANLKPEQAEQIQSLLREKGACLPDKTTDSHYGQR